MESDIPSSSNQSSITQFFNRLRATDIAGTYRKHAARHIIRVPVDGSRLHTSFSSLYKRVLIPRIRRAVNIPAHDVVQRTNDAANYLARTTIEQMAVCLRNKLESYGEPQIARDLLGVTPLAVGTDQLAFAATLIETFGTFSVMERHHDRVLYVAELTRGSNGRFGCTAAQVRRNRERTLKLAISVVLMQFPYNTIPTHSVPTLTVEPRPRRRRLRLWRPQDGPPRPDRAGQLQQHGRGPLVAHGHSRQ
jgi:hypothetical protein